MKKYILILAVAFFRIPIYGQIYLAKTCEIAFFSASPLENIEAINTSSKPLLNIATNDVQVKISMSGFIFKKPLMQEHFNENYAESEKFPNAIFKGKINEKIDFSKDGEYKATVTGPLELHGVTKERTIEGAIIVKDGLINLQGKFNIHIADHGIKVPSLYVKNIAEDVMVKINASLEPFKKK